MTRGHTLRTMAQPRSLAAASIGSPRTSRIYRYLTNHSSLLHAFDSTRVCLKDTEHNAAGIACDAPHHKACISAIHALLVCAAAVFTR